MFSFGWGEIFLVVIIVVIVIGPKELPNFLRQIGKFSNSLKKISREFKSSLNEIADQTDLKEVKKTVKNINNLKDDFNVKKSFEKEIKELNDTKSLVEKELTETESQTNTKTEKDIS